MELELPLDQPDPPEVIEEGPADQYVVAGQWQLVWWKFRKHRLAMLGGTVTILIYIIAIFANFFAPFSPEIYSSDHTYAPPQRLYLFDRSEGGLRWAPYVNGYTVEINYEAGRREFVIDETVRHPIGFFVRGEPYRLLGLFEAERHLIGPINAGDPMYLVGADRLGRDMLSRTIYGTRVSMTIGLVGVALSLFLGHFTGGAIRLLRGVDRQPHPACD